MGDRGVNQFTKWASDTMSLESRDMMSQDRHDESPPLTHCCQGLAQFSKHSNVSWLVLLIEPNYDPLMYVCKVRRYVRRVLWT